MVIRDNLAKAPCLDVSSGCDQRIAEAEPLFLAKTGATVRTGRLLLLTVKVYKLIFFLIEKYYGLSAIFFSNFNQIRRNPGTGCGKFLLTTSFIDRSRSRPRKKRSGSQTLGLTIQRAAPNWLHLLRNFWRNCCLRILPFTLIWNTFILKILSDSPY